MATDMGAERKTDLGTETETDMGTETETETDLGAGTTRTARLIRGSVQEWADIMDAGWRADVTFVSLGGEEYAILPRREYQRLAGALGADGNVEALPFMTAILAADMKRARETAGLTQAALAKKIGKSQPMVAMIESGRARPNEAYVRAVLKACKLPRDWKS